MRETTHRIAGPVVAALAGGLIVGALLAQRAPSAAGGESAPVGRYELTRMDENSVYLLDTRTGHVWHRYGTGTAPWDDQGTPGGDAAGKPISPPPARP